MKPIRKYVMKSCLILLAGLAFTSHGFAYPDFTGYAGSPVSNGSCAASCHGSPNSFVPTATGWPSVYNPGQTYTITLTHDGNTMSNFNGCVLRQNNNIPAGILQSGSNTSTYTHGSEGTGIHGSQDDQTSYTFSWVAPSAGTGVVNLYIAVHEGNEGGPNGVGIYQSGEVGIEETVPVTIPSFSLNILTSNPSNDFLKIGLIVNITSSVRLTVHDPTGKTVDVLLNQRINPGYSVITWQPKVGSGVYFVRLSSNGNEEIKKVIMLK